MKTKKMSTSKRMPVEQAFAFAFAAPSTCGAGYMQPYKRQLGNDIDLFASM
jgi:hypothetical protein